MKRSYELHRKRPKLDIQPSQVNRSTNINDLWGEDISLAAVQEIEQIETQALTQAALKESRVNTNYIGAVSTASRSIHTGRDCDRNVKDKLEEKIGEVKNLRRELEDVRKKHFIELEKFRLRITELEKESAAKESELKFQEKQSLLLKEKIKVNVNSNAFNKNSSVCNEFPDDFAKRFSGGECSHKIPGKFVEDKECKFSCHDGELFHDLLIPVLYSTTELDRGGRKLTNENMSSITDGFFSRFGVHFMKLFRCQSFSDKTARSTITKVIFRSIDELTDLYNTIEKLVDRENVFGRGVQKSSFTRENLFGHIDTTEEELLLSNKPWYLEECGIYLRQTVTMLSILICIDPTLVDLLVQQDPLQRIENEDLSQRSMYILVLLLRLVSMLDKKNVTNQYLGLVSAVVYFYKTLYHCCVPTMKNETYEKLVSDSLHCIILSTQCPAVVTHIMKFLRSSITSANISQNLCRRSDADTFVEDNISYTFSGETCALQVLCVEIELMLSYPTNFIFEFLLWVAALTSREYSADSWLHNKTDATLCECLPCFEQTLIKVMNNCIEQYKNCCAVNQRNILENSLHLIRPIFIRLKHHDEDFEVHISRYQGQYVHLLNNMKVVFSDTTPDIVEFVLEELERLTLNDICASTNIAQTKTMNSVPVSSLTGLKDLITSSIFNESSVFQVNDRQRDESSMENEESEINNDNMGAVVEEDSMSVKDYLQSTLTQRYFG